MDDEELGNTAVRMEGYAWKELDKFNRNTVFSDWPLQTWGYIIRCPRR